MSKSAQLLKYLVWRDVPDEVVTIFKKCAASNYLPVPAVAGETFHVQNALHQLGEWGNLFPGKYPGGIPNHPTALASMLLLGLVGGGLGYGASSLIGAMLPNSWDKSKLRRTGLLGGAAIGIMPGLLKGLTNLAAKQPFNYPNTFPDRRGYVNIRPSGNFSDDYAQQYADKTAEKAAEYMTTFGGPGPFLDVDLVHQTVWGDPRVAERLDTPTQAATSGIVSVAANLPGKQNTRFVTPLDMARMTAGMGTGFLSGAIVGKVLGTLFGLPVTAQERLKQTGMFAGAIANIVPLAFGG